MVSEAETIVEGRYRLTEVLGRGSFGTTHAADDLQTGGRVAVKQLDLRHVDDWKVVELFEREARVLANLDHPQIPNYIEFVPVAADATGYLVQELAPGRSLAERLDAGERFDEGRLRELSAQLLEILVYLAARMPPVVHRDIKPGNVMLADDGRCYLVDFGAVQDAVEARTTGGSTVAGTFGYMAPEQLHGQADASSDLYALGATLVHLMTGIEPSLLPRKRLKLDFRSHVEVSEGFGEFVDRLVEPVPDDRFSGPREALLAIEGLELAPSTERLPATLSGDAIAAAVARKEAEAEAEAARQRALAKQRIAEVARSASRRVAVVEDDEGLTLTIAPRSLKYRFGVQLPLVLFLIVNPGFVVAGGFPFFGRLWPIFADNGVARFMIWGLFLSALSLAIAHRRGRSLHLRVAGSHFLAYHRDPAQPVAMGSIDQLTLNVGQAGDDGYGMCNVHGGELSESFDHLSEADLDALRAFSERAR